MTPRGVTLTPSSFSSVQMVLPAAGMAKGSKLAATPSPTIGAHGRGCKLRELSGFTGERNSKERAHGSRARSSELLPVTSVALAPP